MLPTLFLPVENQVRELDAKLLFACFATARGFPVVLGDKQSLHFAMPDFEPGIFVAKSMRARSRLMFDIIHDLGHRLVAWDEESLVRYDCPAEYYAWRFSPHTFNRVEHLFAWGDDDAAMFAAYPHNRGVGIHATGNPRIDLLRPELRAYFEPERAALEARFGRYVLVNTNFSFVNPFVAGNALVAPEGRFGRRESRAGLGMSAAFARAMADHQQAIFDAFLELMPRLAARFADRTIVLRPHPSENHEVWRRLLAAHDNVVVCHEGSVVPWLLAAEVLLHNGCTTAVEASLVGCPAIAYRPVRDAALDYALPNGLSHRADDVAAVLERLAAVLDGRLGALEGEARERLWRRHLTATAGRYAGERIVEVLERIAGDAPGTAPAAGRRALARLKSGIRRGIKRINMRRPGHWASARYGRHRFPGVSADEVAERVARLSALAGSEAAPSVEQVGALLFALAPGDRDRAAVA